MRSAFVLSECLEGTRDPPVAQSPRGRRDEEWSCTVHERARVPLIGSDPFNSVNEFRWTILIPASSALASSGEHRRCCFVLYAVSVARVASSLRGTRECSRSHGQNDLLKLPLSDEINRYILIQSLHWDEIRPLIQLYDGLWVTQQTFGWEKKIIVIANEDTFNWMDCQFDELRALFNRPINFRN